jgi:hypothetical protein
MIVKKLIRHERPDLVDLESITASPHHAIPSGGLTG